MVNWIQRRAAQIVTGAFKTTAGSAVEVEAHIILAAQQLEQIVMETVMRIRSSPLYCDMAITRSGVTSRSPLERALGILEKKYKIQHDQLETRCPQVVPPWWEPPRTFIAEYAEKAIQQHN